MEKLFSGPVTSPRRHKVVHLALQLPHVMASFAVSSMEKSTSARTSMMLKSSRSKIKLTRSSKACIAYEERKPEEHDKSSTPQLELQAPQIFPSHLWQRDEYVAAAHLAHLMRLDASQEH